MAKQRKHVYVPIPCKGCRQEFTPKASCQKFCVICIPNKKAQGRRQIYGLTQPEFERMLQEQDGKCFFCRRDFAAMFNGKFSPICVDHDHQTNRVRGLLCRKCNMLLGWLELCPPGILRKIESYLSHPCI